MPGPTATAGVVGRRCFGRRLEPPRQQSAAPLLPLSKEGTLPFSSNLAPRIGLKNTSEFCLTLPGSADVPSAFGAPAGGQEPAGCPRSQESNAKMEAIPCSYESTTDRRQGKLLQPSLC
jgi:hypothetical protein